MNDGGFTNKLLSCNSGTIEEEPHPEMLVNWKRKMKWVLQSLKRWSSLDNAIESLDPKANAMPLPSFSELPSTTATE